MRTKRHTHTLFSRPGEWSGQPYRNVRNLETNSINASSCVRVSELDSIKFVKNRQIRAHWKNTKSNRSQHLTFDAAAIIFPHFDLATAVKSSAKIGSCYSANLHLKCVFSMLNACKKNNTKNCLYSQNGPNLSMKSIPSTPSARMHDSLISVDFAHISRCEKDANAGNANLTKITKITKNHRLDFVHPIMFTLKNHRYHETLSKIKKRQ